MRRRSTGWLIPLGAAVVVLLSLVVPPSATAATSAPAARRAADVSLQLATSSRLIPYGRGLTLSARLLDSSTSDPVPSQTLQLQVRADSSGPWQIAAAGVTNSVGRVTWKLSPQRTNQYRAVHQANPSYAAKRTPAVTVTLKPALQANLRKDWARQGGAALIHGRVRPAFRGEPVVLERRLDGHWVRMARTKQDENGKYSFRMRGWAKRGAFFYRTAIGTTSSHGSVHSATLQLNVVRLVTYRIETRGRIVASVSDFAKRAAEIYADPRGWSRAFVHFKQVKGSSDFSLVLSQAKYVPRFASICDRYWSCRVGRYVIINENRWRWGTPYFKHSGGSIRDYRAMVIDHETGHWFGLGHSTCPGKGRRAPVMMQQSKGLHGCVVNSWPVSGEIARVR